LDEPTNDLDVETLEALEQRLRDYRGTLIVVSHDRHFLDAVVTSTLVFEAGGTVTRYAGGYSDWARGKRDLAVGDELARPQKDAPTDNKPKQKSGKLPYKLQRELGQLPMVIASLEERLASLQEEIVDPDFYKQTHEKTKSRLQALANCEAELATVTDRWIELEDLVTAGSGTI
jgi:ATP-binding cassette subfamily F protein uup